MKLKQVIHYPETNSVEATWVEVVTPAIDVPESVEPDTTDADGNVIPGKVTPAHTIPAVEVQVRCHSYADVQMSDLEADLGADAADHADLIALVKSNIKQPTAQEIAAKAEADRLASIPAYVSPRQIRQALTKAGLRNRVEDTIISGDQDLKDWWEFSTTFERNHPMVTSMATQLGITTMQLDDLWLLAASL